MVDHVLRRRPAEYCLGARVEDHEQVDVVERMNRCVTFERTGDEKLLDSELGLEVAPEHVSLSAGVAPGAFSASFMVVTFVALGNLQGGDELLHGLGHGVHSRLSFPEFAKDNHAVRDRKGRE